MLIVSIDDFVSGFKFQIRCFALKIASSFGGGLGAQREVCSAVSGMCMALGLKRGYKEPKDYAAKQKHYLAVQEICTEFKKQNGSIICRELLQGVDSSNSPIPTISAR